MNWISVKERLPSFYTGILFAHVGFMCDAKWFEPGVAYGNFSDNKWIFCWDEWQDYAIPLEQEYITHWMPLPDPPVIVECSEAFTYDSHTCTPCKHYSKCVAKECAE